MVPPRCWRQRASVVIASMPWSAGRDGRGLPRRAARTRAQDGGAQGLARRRLMRGTQPYFEVERQLLAQMRHPAIAQVYDAGTTAEGHPFFAMEFIEGSPVTRYCEARAVPLPQRPRVAGADLRRRAARAPEGRDPSRPKPANLLVDEVDGRSCRGSSTSASPPPAA